MGEYRIPALEVTRKEVTVVGNGAHVLVPKDWLGEEVAVVRLPDDNADIKHTDTGTDT